MKCSMSWLNSEMEHTVFTDWKTQQIKDVNSLQFDLPA